jgi:hypothetical protein
MLPQAPPPQWFVSTLELAPGGTVVVLDDDTSIHQIWQGRFDSMKAKEQGIEVLHFSTPADLRGFVFDHPGQAHDALYLTDYELVGYKETGLGLIEELKLGEQSILVTSRFEEKGILDQCLRLKVRMIPKGLAGFVPMEFKPAPPQRQAGPDVLLLDDDALTRMTWEMTAKAKGIKLAAFSNPNEFLAAAAGVPKDTAIYLDCELSGGVRGEAVAKDLHSQGFTNLSLATGHPPDTLPSMPWIRQVVGKEPPWGET